MMLRLSILSLALLLASSTVDAETIKFFADVSGITGTISYRDRTTGQFVSGAISSSARLTFTGLADELGRFTATTLSFDSDEYDFTAAFDGTQGADVSGGFMSDPVGGDSLSARALDPSIGLLLLGSSAKYGTFASGVLQDGNIMGSLGGSFFDDPIRNRSYSVQFSFDYTAVPEPSSLALCGLGLLTFGLVRRWA